MDTDDLSIATYNGIIIESEKFNHNLTIQFGVLASFCNDDDDYLNKVEALIKDWLNEDDMYHLIDDIFFGQQIDEKGFRVALNRILSNIADIKKTPMEKRKFEVWD